MTLRAIELARDAAHPLGLLLKFPLLFGVLLLVALSAAEDPHRDGPSYFFEANVVLPKNVSLTGAVGAKCVDTLQSWSSPAESQRAVKLGTILGAFLPHSTDGRCSADTINPKEAFNPNYIEILAVLSQLHPGARHARYDPLDPAVRSARPAVGVLTQRMANGSLEFDYRVHAEFLVSTSPPLFVMPGQLRARLQVSRDLAQVEAFQLWLPQNRVYNALVECGEPFLALGDRDEEALSPDARRWSPDRLILRASRGEEEPPGTELGPPEDGEPGEEEEQGSAASAAAQGLSAPEAPGAEMGGGAGEEGEGSCTAPGGCGAGGGTGRAQRDAVRAGEPAEVSVVMGQVLLHPGEGDSDSGSDGAGESGGADGGAVLETAVQEIAIPALGLHLAGAPAAPPARPAWVEPALGVAAMPFLDAGYRADFHAAYSGAREQVLRSLLSEPGVRALLQASFVATWALKDDLRTAVAAGGERGRVARLLLEPASELAQVLVVGAPDYAPRVYAETGAEAAHDRTLGNFMSFLHAAL